MSKNALEIFVKITFNKIRCGEEEDLMKSKYIVFFLNKIKKKMHHVVDIKMKEHGITDLVPSYGDVLGALYINGGTLKMHEISEAVGKDKSTVTVLVSRLIERGYISKEKSKLDKRVTNISLTEKAFTLENSFNEIANLINDIAYVGFTDEEIETFQTMLERVNANYDAHNLDNN